MSLSIFKPNVAWIKIHKNRNLDKNCSRNSLEADHGAKRRLDSLESIDGEIAGVDVRKNKALDLLVQDIFLSLGTEFYYKNKTFEKYNLI